METINNLIVVKQLPIIEEKLKTLSLEIDEKVNKAMSLVVCEDTIKEVKKVRAELNSDFKELENQRKLVKEQVLTPYDNFEKIYKSCVTEKFKNADNNLKNKINAVEEEQKEIKRNEVKEYFKELATSLHLDWINENEMYYSMANINVTLTASMKSLKESAKSFLEKINDDMNLIQTQEHKEEIEIEYKKCLNVSKAITEVKERYKQLEIIEQQKTKQEEIRKIEEEKKQEVEEMIIAPAKEIKQEKIYELSFKVKGTKEQLMNLKQFLEGGGYDYE